MRIGNLNVSVLSGSGGTAAVARLSACCVQRLAGEEDLIAQIDNRMRADPVFVPNAAQEAEDNFASGGATGSRVGASHLHVLTLARPKKRVYNMNGAFPTDAGRRHLVDRGHVPEADDDNPLDPWPVKRLARGMMCTVDHSYG